MRQLSKAARNERRKITATYLNTLASALIVVGIFAPSFAIVYGSVPIDFQALNVVLAAVVCIAVSVSLHWLARRMLKGVEE